MATARDTAAGSKAWSARSSSVTRFLAVITSAAFAASLAIGTLFTPTLATSPSSGPSSIGSVSITWIAVTSGQRLGSAATCNRPHPCPPPPTPTGPPLPTPGPGPDVATYTANASTDVGLGSWLNEAGGMGHYYDVDEGLAAADDSGLKQATNGSPGGLQLRITASPAGLTDGSVTAVTFNLRHKQSGRSDDTMVWKVQIIDEITNAMLASATSGETATAPATDVGAANPYRTVYGNNGAVSFAYVNTAATKAQWDQADIYFKGTKSTVKGADTVTWFIDTFDVVITYTVTAPVTTPAQKHLAATGVGQ